MSSRSRMIVLSWDAVGSIDLPYLKTLPNFRAFLKRAAGCEQVKSVYPSLTYPAHASIVSGKYPGRHGVVNNFLVQPDRVPSDWFWQRRYIQGEVFYEMAQRAGKKVAALLWPVTGKAKISYNLPEVLPNRPWQNQILVSMCNGTPGYELHLERKFGHMRAGICQPQLDSFVHASALETLKRYQPDLMLVHLTDVDTHRHHFGLNGMEITRALERHDQRLGELTALLEKLGWQEDTNLIILGDHCQMDVSRVCYPNFELVRRGYAEVKNGKIRNWNAIARECDGSCYIYIKEKQLTEEIGRLLEEMKSGGEFGIRQIFTGEEAAAMGADPSCAFMLEAEDGCYFQNGWEKPWFSLNRSGRLEAAGEDDPKEEDEEIRTGEDAAPKEEIAVPPIQLATHGYLPDREAYQTIFFGAGPDFQPGARVETMSLVDEGPTMARILGLEMKDTDGRVLTELLRSGNDGLPAAHR